MHNSGDSFLNAETAIQNKLQTAYPNQYPLTPALHTRYVAYYNGSSVQFQVPVLDIHNGEGNLPVTTVEPTTKFFMVALDDPNGWLYQLFDSSTVAAIPIYMKGNELANIIWRIKEITQSPRVIIVAHSMGGLDTRSYIEGLASPTGDTQAAIPYQNDIATLATLDTPHGGADLSFLSAAFGGCAANPSTDKSEMFPANLVMSQLNYSTPAALPLPKGLTITSIASYWYAPNSFFPRLDALTDDVLSVQTQDLYSNLASPSSNSNSTLISKSNIFSTDFYAIDSSGATTANICGGQTVTNDGLFPTITFTVLHYLSCTGSQQQTFAEIQNDIAPFLFMNGSTIQINSSTTNVSPGTTATFTTPGMSGVVWSILEGAHGGNISQTGLYTPPANITGISETFHIIAINSQDLYHYGVATVQVGKNASKVATTTVLTPTASQVPVGVSLTINATVQASGGTPTGTVTFYDGGRMLSAALLNNAGVATYSSSSFTLGSHTITAQYGGDSNYTASTSSVVTIAIVAIKPQLSVSPATGTIGVTAFVKTDTGFTPYGLITHTATLPDKSLSILQTYADGTGSYQYNRTYSTAGPYSQVDTDGASGQTTTPVTWTVSAVVTNDFTLQVSPSSQSVSQGSSVSYNVVTATSSGSAQNIALSASNVPSGLTASFNPATVTSGSQSALTLAVSSTVQTGNYALTVVGTGSSVSHTYPISVTVTQATTGAKLQASPSSFNFTPAQTVNTASAPFVFSLVNSGGSALTISSLTASAQFVPSFQNGQGLPITLQPNGGYVNMQVVFIPTSAGEQTGTIKLFNTTNSSPLTISLSGTGVAAPVTTGNIQINATLNGSPWPGELTYAYNLTGSQSFTGDSSPLTYYNVVPGAYVLAYLGTTSGGASFTGITPSATQTLTAGATITYTLNFTGTNSFVTGNPNPLSATIGVGSNATFQVSPSITSGGQQSVNLSATGVPAGANVSFSNNPVSICSGCGTQSSTVTIATSPSTPPGVYSVVITGTNQYGLASQAHPFSLAINLPPTSAIQLVSKSSAGVEGNAFSGAFFSNTNLVSSAVSSNGRFVAFDSAATNLISNDTNSQPDIFVRDLQAGTTTRVSVASNGTQTDLDSSAPSISADGRYVSFTSEASNLTAVSTQGQNGIYLHDTTSGLTTRVDLAPNGTPANATSSSSSISADGRFIAFSSGATNLMPSAANGGVFVWDTKAGQMLLASISNDGTTSGQGSSPLISADGRFVAFTSNSASLVTGDTNGRADLFVHDFITGTTTRANVASDGTQDNCGIAFTVSTAMSADGRYLSFISCGSTLAPGFTNPNGYTSAYIHDMITGVTTPLATTPQGVILSAGNVGTISADGRFAAYNTYLVDRTTGSSTSLNVATGGTPGNGTSGTVSTSLDGSNLVFSSISSNLVTGDSNSATDVFLFPNPFVASPRVTSLTLAQSTAAGGATIAGSIVLSGPAPVGGATVAVSSNHSAAQIPATVFVPAGMSSAPISFGTSLVQSETVITAVASYNGGSPIALLTLEPSGQIAVSPTTWDFGYQAVGTSSAAESFALTNSGTAALTINSVQLTSGQVFSISANTCGSSIVAGGSCSISVTFKPSASGSASDAVQISYGSPATIQSISLTGNGATPLAALSPVPLSFGNQAMPGSTTAVATLSNSGNASLTNISISIYGTNAGDFAISSDGCSGEILPANSNCQVSIVFTPKSKGSRQATLSIADSASGSPQTISLTGTGVQSTPTLLWNPSAASITYGTPLGTGVLDATANQSGSNLAPTITFTVPNHTYGDAPFTVSATSNSSGAITYSVVSGPATISGSTVTLTGAGNSGATGEPGCGGQLHLARRPPPSPLRATPRRSPSPCPNHTYGDAPFTVSATSNSSGAITYSVVSGPATISGSTVTLTGAGSVVLQASQVAAGNYTAGTQTATVTVAKESQTITFSAPASPVNYGVAPITLSASASSLACGSVQRCLRTGNDQWQHADHHRCRNSGGCGQPSRQHQLRGCNAGDAEHRGQPGLADHQLHRAYIAGNLRRLAHHAGCNRRSLGQCGGIQRRLRPGHGQRQHTDDHRSRNGGGGRQPGGQH
jgi:hypothetical protein